MEQGFINILKKLMNEQGSVALTDAKKCKAFLADYTGSEYKKERRLIIQAAEAGVSKVIDGAQDLDSCKKAKAGELEEEYSLSPLAAADTVDALALVLRGDMTRTQAATKPVPKAKPKAAPEPPPEPAPPKAAPEPAPKAAARPAYAIGSTGPAGGLIFYDKGSVSDGWRYLEAAPAHREFKGKWGKSWEYWLDKNKCVSTYASIGSGRGNTRSMDVDGSPIARQVTELNINGFTDWFLPSSYELDLMYKNLKEKGLGGFSDNWYWSSTQSTDSDHKSAEAQSFKNGYQTSTYKDGNNLVRAVRAF